MTLSKSARRELSQSVNKIYSFARLMLGIILHPYQRLAAEEIIKSVFEADGRSFVIIFSRQSGKDEMLAIIFLFLMLRFNFWGCDIVSAQPTFKPQTINAMERLKKRGFNYGRALARTAGYIMRFHQARVSYFSAEPAASQVGATASHLLVINEAQDVLASVYDKRFSPMAASGNATKVFSGTSWTSNTLLAREKNAALEAEKRDGKKRVFIVDADEVGVHNPRYRLHVEAEIRKHGRDHPFIKTQYFCEEIDAEAGMFNAAALALMAADRPPLNSPPNFEEIGGSRRGVYAFLIDAAGQDENRMNDPDGELKNAARDAVSLSIVDIDLSTVAILKLPTYRAVHRQRWTGLNHLAVFGQLKALAEAWQPQYIVEDATGVGEGLWALLDRFFPGKVIPVKFTAQVKSEIGWMFLSVINTGRFRNCSGEGASGDHRPCAPQGGRTPSRAEVELQYRHCQSEILPGPAKTLRWGVPEGTRDNATGALIHDDDLLADSLCTQLDKLDWYIPYKPFMIHPKDPLADSLTR